MTVQNIIDLMFNKNQTIRIENQSGDTLIFNAAINVDNEISQLEVVGIGMYNYIFTIVVNRDGDMK